MSKTTDSCELQPRGPHAIPRWMRAGCCVAVTMLFAGLAPARAENLLDAYRQAVQHDPVVQQAAAVDRQGRAGVGIALGPLLPQLGVGAQLVSEGSGLAQPSGTQSPGELGGSDQSLGASGIAGLGTVRERQYSASLNQVLFDLGDIEHLRASRAAARANTASLVSAQQTLILRVTRAYFTILTDEDQLQFDETNAASQKQLRDEARDRLHSGLTARMVVSDADAAYQQAVAQVLLDRNTLANDRRALAEITGQPTGALAALGGELPLDPPQPDNEDAWVKQALAANPTLAAKQDQVASAQHDVAAAHAAHLPTLTATAEYARDAFWTGAVAGVDSGGPLDGADAVSLHGRESGTTVGVVLTVPLFSGGTAHAQVRQALATRDQAAQILIQTQRGTVTAVQNAFGSIETDIAIVRADKRGVVSAKSALDSTEAGFRVGTDNITDVLVARSTYLQLLGAYSRARHDLVINRLALKLAAGTLSMRDLEQANALLQ